MYSTVLQIPQTWEARRRSRLFECERWRYPRRVQKAIANEARFLDTVAGS
jgi:hypothetical protein